MYTQKKYVVAILLIISSRLVNIEDAEGDDPSSKCYSTQKQVDRASWVQQG
jgi:hypothetical protein